MGQPWQPQCLRFFTDLEVKGLHGKSLRPTAHAQAQTVKDEVQRLLYVKYGCEYLPLKDCVNISHEKLGPPDQGAAALRLSS